MEGFKETELPTLLNQEVQDQDIQTVAVRRVKQVAKSATNECVENQPWGK